MMIWMSSGSKLYKDKGQTFILQSAEWDLGLLFRKYMPVNPSAVVTDAESARFLLVF
jgi:hypothetical protein